MSAKHTFPQRLQVILDDPLLADIICWLPMGDSFVILRSDKLCSQVLPHYFSPENSLKYSSFKRKLNRWGFHQIRKGPDTGAFHHPLFKRHQRNLCLHMDCEKAGASKNNGKMSCIPTVSPEMESIATSSSQLISTTDVPPRLPPESNLKFASPISRIIHESVTKFQSQRMPSSGNKSSSEEDEICWLAPERIFVVFIHTRAQLIQSKSMRVASRMTPTKLTPSRNVKSTQKMNLQESRLSKLYIILLKLYIVGRWRNQLANRLLEYLLPLPL